MGNRKMTPAQLAALRVIAEAEDAGAPVYRYSSGRKLYEVSNGLKSAVVHRLFDHHVIAIRGALVSSRPTFHLTDHGRAVLAAQDPTMSASTED